jgi:hypothetical protein
MNRYRFLHLLHSIDCYMLFYLKCMKKTQPCADIYLEQRILIASSDNYRCFSLIVHQNSRRNSFLKVICNVNSKSNQLHWNPLVLEPVCVLLGTELRTSLEPHLQSFCFWHIVWLTFSGPALDLRFSCLCFWALGYRHAPLCLAHWSYFLNGPFCYAGFGKNPYTGH